jgi:hypothetical protein
MRRGRAGARRFLGFWKGLDPSGLVLEGEGLRDASGEAMEAIVGYRFHGSFPVHEGKLIRAPAATPCGCLRSEALLEYRAPPSFRCNRITRAPLHDAF